MYQRCFDSAAETIFEQDKTHRKPLQTAADYFQSDLRYLSARDSLEMQ